MTEEMRKTIYWYDKRPDTMGSGFSKESRKAGKVGAIDLNRLFRRINWRSIAAAGSTALALLAALPYQLGEVATIIPPKWKPIISITGIISAFILRVLNSVNPHP